VIPHHLYLTQKPHLNLNEAVELVLVLVLVLVLLLLLPPFRFGEEWTYLAVH
jgi:hypothetical protein